MMIVLSPSKKLDESSEYPKYSENIGYTEPEMLEQSVELVDILRGMTENDIKEFMGVSDKIAALNKKRYQDFKIPFTHENAYPAIYLFKGDVYDAMNAMKYSVSELEFASKHLRILSGLYGILKPLDIIQPYRLEMGKKLANERGKNLYDFWGDSITDNINESLEAEGSGYLINLASAEYFKSINKKKLEAEIINIDFKDQQGDSYKTIGLFAKRARGMMADFIIENKITEPEILKSFTSAGYSYDEEMSKNDFDMVFKRDIADRKAA